MTQLPPQPTDAPSTPSSDLPAWETSSLDLERGLEVSEEALETLPGDLQDAFLDTHF